MKIHEMSRHIVNVATVMGRPHFGLSLHVSGYNEAGEHFLSTWVVILGSSVAQHSHMYFIFAQLASVVA